MPRPKAPLLLGLGGREAARDPGLVGAPTRRAQELGAGHPARVAEARPDLGDRVLDRAPPREALVPEEGRRGGALDELGDADPGQAHAPAGEGKAVEERARRLVDSS